MTHQDAIDWLKKAFHVQASDGISSLYETNTPIWHAPYPEVSGYSIPTLIEAGEEEIALRISRWLRKKQLYSGGIPMGYNDSYIPFVFDTGQVLLGWIAAQALEPDPRTEESIEHAVRWMEKEWRENRWVCPNVQEYAPTINLRALWPLKILNSPLVDEIMEHFIERIQRNGFPEKTDEQHPDEPLTHFVIYVARALWELGEKGVPRQMMTAIANAQTLSFPARFNRDWEPTTDEVCVPAVAQAAILWKKMGWRANVHKAKIFLKRLDAPWASFPKDGDYLPYSQTSWSAKFIADALKEDQ